jgi:hypothetical protein
MTRDLLQRNRTRRAASSFGEVLGVVSYLGMFLLTIWGIGWSFYRHSPGDGIASVVVWPYAWYRRVAAIWEEPKWKEDYDVRTEQLALVIENAVNPDASYQIQSRGYVRDLKSWLKSMPRIERDRLREAARNYALAMNAYCELYVSGIAAGSDNPRVDLDPAVQQRVDGFKAVKGLLNGWERVVRDAANLKNLSTADQDSENDLRDSSSLTVGERAIAQNRLRAYLDTMQMKMENIINELFSE